MNRFIQSRTVTLPDPRDTSSDSVGSSSGSSSTEEAENVPEPLYSRDLRSAAGSSSIDTGNVSQPFQEDHLDINPAPESPLVASDEEFVEIEASADPPLHLLKGTPDFRKFVDQMREELLAIFVPEIPHQNFPSHMDLKFAFACILQAAGIWRKQEYREIIVRL